MKKRAPGCLGYIVGDEILPSCVVIEMNQPGFHGKDPAVFFFRGSSRPNFAQWDRES